MKTTESLAALTVALATFGLVSAGRADDNCRYDGTIYSQGSTVCQSGTQYRCDDGAWKSLKVACPQKAPEEAKSCTFGGESYSSGSASCQGGTQYRCLDGAWNSLGAPCAADRGAADAPAPRTCMFDGSTVSSSSTLCRSGVMYLCADGEWRNLGTPCQ